MATKTGFASKLYRNTGSYGSPTWVEIANCKDLNVTVEFTQHEATTRQHEGGKAYLPTLVDYSVEFSMNYDTADTNYTALRTACMTRASVEILALDGASNVAGSQGLRATVGIFSWPVAQPLDGNLVTDGIKMAPHADAANAPAWYTVGG